MVDVDTLLGQIPTIVGVLIGSIATYLATSATSKVQWRRETQARWTQMQISAYTDHAHALKNMTDLARRIAAYGDIDGVADPLSPDVGLPQLSAAEQDRSAKWESVLMVGDPAVIEAGQKWKQCVWRLEWLARSRSDVGLDWASALSQVGDAKHGFYQAVRRSIGTPGGSLRRFGLAPWIGAMKESRATVSSSALTDEVTPPN
ncbi:hypothetical protein ACWD8I_03625 [Micromonospora arida]|uniref:hypothetical protein n=1 Tax=Micromonospora arida TaxID=2203715 RepID=UPI0033FC01D8